MPTMMPMISPTPTSPSPQSLNDGGGDNGDGNSGGGATGGADGGRGADWLIGCEQAPRRCGQRCPDCACPPTDAQLPKFWAMRKTTVHFRDLQTDSICEAQQRNRGSPPGAGTCRMQRSMRFVTSYTTAVHVQLYKTFGRLLLL